MAKTAEVIKEEYAKNLKPFDYVAWLKKLSTTDDKVFRVPCEFYYSVLQSGKFKGSRMLDIGSGAVVHNVASASAFFPNILMCDYVEDNCEELKRWLRGESKLEQFLDIPAQLEGYGSDLKAGKERLEKRIRESVKQVARCDVLDNNFFLEEIKPEVSPPYDLVLSNCCLEAASPTFEDFILVLKRINKLVRTGGGLMLAGVIQGQSWRVTETDFHCIAASEEDFKRALKEAGFGNVAMKTYDKLDTEYEHEGIYVLVAEKIDLKAGKERLEKRIRESVKQVARCDVLDDKFFLEKIKPEVSPPYDLVLSSYCLEAASPAFEDFVLVLKRINQLMRTGGGLLLAGCFQGQTWRVTDTDFQYIQVNDEDVKKALKESGFGIVDMKTHGKLNIDYEHEGWYVLAAEKM